MRRMVQFGGLLLVACLSAGDGGVAPPRAAIAACRVKTRAVAVNAVAVAPVPLAVAIGVPVAEVTPYYYSYSANNANAPTPSPTVDVDTLATKLAEKLTAKNYGAGVAPAQSAGEAPAPQPAKLAAQSLIAQKCAQCHSGPAPKGKLSLENPAALDCPTRLKAIRAILSEKMPQGGPRLTPDEAGKLLEELVGQ
jgi:mono/diheme cytochrome c family protein